MEEQNREEKPNEVQPPSQVEHEHENSSEDPMNITICSLETNTPGSSYSSAATIVPDDTETMKGDAAETLSTFSKPDGK